MATTNLADLVQRTEFQSAALLASIRKSVFWQSGLVVSDDELQRLAKADVGASFEFDYFNDLADNEGNVSDDSATLATPDNITTGTDRAQMNFRNRGWGAKNITKSLSASGDPMEAIASRVGEYWARQTDLTTLSLVRGIFADNVANDASDMVNDQTDTAISLNMILDTQQTMGDAQDVLGTMICHSAVRTALRKSGVTDKIFSDSGEYLYESLSGLRLVVTDSVPTSGSNFTSYIISGGQIGYGEGIPKRQEEVHWSPSTGNGAGEETLWSRRNFVLHPYGFSFTGASVASTSPTNAEHELAANWNRNVERKRVGFASLVSAV